MTTKPSFLCSQSQRKKAEGSLYVDRLEEHYRQIAAGLYEWDTGIEDMPKGYIEDTALFFAPGVGTKKVRGFGQVVVPISPVNLTIYGTPYEWLPERLFGMPLPEATDLFNKSKEPCLWIGSSTQERIEPYLDLMKQTLQSLSVNITSLTQPVILSGIPPGSELSGLLLENALYNGQRIIPVVKKELIDMQVLDLKATDNTQNLISTAHWCDARILEIMASSNGVEKASGITTMETVSGVQSVIQAFNDGLDLRKEWVDKVNDRFKLDWTVAPGKGFDALTAGQRPAQNEGDDSEGTEDDSEE